MKGGGKKCPPGGKGGKPKPMPLPKGGKKPKGY